MNLTYLIIASGFVNILLVWLLIGERIEKRSLIYLQALSDESIIFLSASLDTLKAQVLESGGNPVPDFKETKRRYDEKLEQYKKDGRKHKTVFSAFDGFSRSLRSGSPSN
jgi:hypothetical protein